MNRISILAVALFAFPLTVLAQSKYPPSFEGAREEIYKRVGDVELKLWVFEPADLKSSDKRLRSCSSSAEAGRAEAPVSLSIIVASLPSRASSR